MKFSRQDLNRLSRIINIREVIIIISHVLRKEYTDIFFADEISLSDAEYNLIISMIYKRYRGTPLAKIINIKEFYGIEYITNEYTLDPRPETELIVDLFKKYFPLPSEENIGMKNNAVEKDIKLEKLPQEQLPIGFSSICQNWDKQSVPNLRILDLGCGTGCISLSILSIYKNATAVLADIDKNTLDTARINAERLDVIDRCDFVISDWFSNIRSVSKDIKDNTIERDNIKLEKPIQKPISDRFWDKQSVPNFTKNKFDAIVCNPPYIKNDDCSLDESALYDPHIALFAGIDGLDAYRSIIPHAHEFLTDSGFLFVEIGMGQKNDVINLTRTLNVVEIAKDIAGIERVLVLRGNIW